MLPFPIVGTLVTLRTRSKNHVLLVSWDLAFKQLVLRFKTLPEDYSERQMDHSQV
jgi:hypothetical protein